MKKFILTFIIFLVLLVTIILIITYRRIGPLDILVLPNGYVINDRDRSITFFADWDVRNVSIAKDKKELTSFSGDFKLKDDKFWDNLNAISYVGDSNSLVIDQSADGIPDSIILMDPKIKSQRKFALKTYVVDDNDKILHSFERNNNVTELK